MGEAKFVVAGLIFTLSLVFNLVAAATNYWYLFHDSLVEKSFGLWKQCLKTSGGILTWGTCSSAKIAWMRPVQSLTVVAAVCVLGAIISIILARAMKQKALVFLIIAVVSGGAGTFFMLGGLLLVGLTVPKLSPADSWTGITNLPYLGWSYYLAAVHCALAFLATLVTLVIVVLGVVAARREERGDKRRDRPANRPGPPLPSKAQRR